MEQFVINFLSELSTKFYIYQVLTIILLAMYGLVFMTIIRAKELSVFDYILTYPIALVLYSVAGYFMLSIGIDFNKYSIIAMMVVVLMSVLIVFRKNLSSIVIKKEMGGYIIVMIILALVASSGLIPVSASNDSMYFFSEYPRALVHYGKLTSILDNFLTDASQGIAIIGTLPFFYGFDEVYGIQTLLNINFYVFFAYAVYEYSLNILKKKESYLMSFIAVFILITSMPFILMSRWFMANAFYMEYMAIIVYIAYKYSLREERNVTDLLIMSVLITGLSIMRMEGALNAGVIVLCIMMLGFENKDIVTYFVSPVLVLQALYLYRIFYAMTLHTGIQFMTKGKALILLLFLVCIIVYTLLLRGKNIAQTDKYYPYILIAALVLVNLVILIYDRNNYIINLKAFVGNILKNSGWGLFAPLVIGTLIIIPKKSMKINYFDFTVVSYVLLSLVSGWARGDSLYESFGDSGNRIMIQAVPIIVFALIVKVAEGLKYWKKESLN